MAVHQNDYPLSASQHFWINAMRRNPLSFEDHKILTIFSNSDSSTRRSLKKTTHNNFLEIAVISDTTMIEYPV